MKVLLTGVEGYLGAVLAPILLERGYEIVGLDTGFYRDGWLYSSDQRGNPAFPLCINKDLRNIHRTDIAGCDAIIHLAELSNDPLGQQNPDNTYKINHLGSIGLAQLAKAAKIARFVYTSSCSVYGAGSGDLLKEEAPTNPQTAYAHCKVLVERDVSRLADDDFSPTFLRNATAYGASPRMRFDIVLNNLAGWAWTTKKIAMVSDGTPWRPLVHVVDICKAIICALEARREAVHNQIFNVGDNKANYRIRDIAEIIADVFPGCELTFGSSAGDKRTYRVCFDKIHEKLPGFSCNWDARTGAEQLRDLFERIDMSRDTFEFRAYTRLKQLEYLIKTKQIDDEFFWRY
jgi:nucleoside-diphosphate-sugar epimerase